MKKYNVIEQEFNGQKVELIEFYDEHVYKIGDKYYPSISKKLSIIDKGYGFHTWERQVGLQADEIMTRAAESGTKVHNAIESALMGNDIKADDPEYNFTKQEWVKFLQWATWWNHYGFKPLKIEQIVWSEILQTAGKLDCIAEREGKVYVFDWKTGGIYDSYYEQVLFYKSCAAKLGLCPEESIPCLVNVGSSHKKIDEKKLQGVGVGVYEIDPLETSPKLNSSIIAWNVRNQDWTPLTLQYPISVKINNVLEVK